MLNINIMRANKIFLSILLIISHCVKSQEPEPAWELSLSEATTESDYLPANLLELKDGNYLCPLISTLDYQKTDKKISEAKILKISSDGKILDNITIECDKEYKINDISVDIWNDTVNIFSHLIAYDHKSSKIVHNYLYDDLSLSKQKEIYHDDFDTLLKPILRNKIGNKPLIDKFGNRTMSFGYISEKADRIKFENDEKYNDIILMLFVKFDSNFNIMAEKWYDIEELDFDIVFYPKTFIYNEDSTGYFFMSRAYFKPWNIQYVFDLDLNYRYYNSYQCSPQGVFDALYCNWLQNPYDGETYGFGEVYTPWQDSELFMFKLNPDNFEAEYNVSTNTANGMWNGVLPGENICFSPDGNIYGLGIYNYTELSEFAYNSNVCYIGVFDRSVNYLSEWYYQISPDYNHFFKDIYYTESDDIIITGEIRHKENGVIYYEPYMAKFPASAFVSIEEAHAHNLHLAVAYPNPGGDVMNIRTSLRDCTLQVYDMQGRMVHQQEITDDVTSVDASGWSSGTYVWKLTINNEQLTVEEGKWVK